MNMESPYSPPVLFLTDDDDANETEHNISYDNSSITSFDDHSTRRKRKLNNTNIHLNPSVVNWSKRQRYDNYLQAQPTPNFSYHESNPEPINPNDYLYPEHDSHSFLAFDWSTESQMPPRMYSNYHQTTPRVSFVPPANVTNVTKHHLDHSDAVPFIPMLHQHDTYLQQPRRKLINIPMSPNSPPSIPLPLPTPTSSIIRPTAQRAHPGKSIRMPYTNTTSPPLLPIRHHSESIFHPRLHPPSPPVPLLTPTSTPEIRRQALNGTGILSAFYDSKCYRCNVCKFKSSTSSAILQHIFTHVFFCRHCSFYTYSHHSLYQHDFDKHKSNTHNGNIDPKNLDLLYITRCSDGTFALCMDTSTSPPPPPFLTSPSATKSSESLLPPPIVTNPKSKQRGPRKKNPKQKKTDDDDITILSEKTNHKSLSKSSSSSITTERSKPKEKPTHTYVLMKHRRCYSIRNPPCLHTLTLEYNICREHTIRHMCQTQEIFKKRKFKLKMTTSSIIEEVARCLKTTVNNVVNMEENRNLPELVCALPNNIINSILSDDDLDILTNSLKLNNKYEISLEQNELNKSEYSVRTSNQYNFILSAAGINKSDKSIFDSINTSVTNADSVYTRTNMENLMMLNDNTHRFLKGNLEQPTQSSNTGSNPPKKRSTTQSSKQSTNSEPVNITGTHPLRSINRHPSSPNVDRNNNPVTLSKAELSSIASVIVLD